MYEVIVRVGDGARWPVREYFEMKTRQCRDHRQVFVPSEVAYWGGLDKEEAPRDAAAMEDAGDGEPSHPDDVFRLEGDSGDLAWVRHLYRKSGWLGEGWRREDCLKAIAEYVDRRNAEED